MSLSETDVQCFEQPLDERTRIFLRLEYLIARLRYHEPDHSAWGRRATVDVLLDVLSVLARFDVAGEISKALGQRYAQLERLRADQRASAEQIDPLLAEIDALGEGMQHVPSHFASYLLRDNELLNSLNNRRPMPGGSCGFDLPTYQYWLAQSEARVDRDIAIWCAHIEAFEAAIGLLLRLLRDAVPTETQTAEAGVLIYNTPADTRIIRVLLDNADVFPQISAGRHRATIRFMQYRPDSLAVRQMQSEVVFRMACCNG